MLGERVDGVLLAFVSTLALLTRFTALNFPREVVFDEVHFGTFTNAYLNGKYFFDIHPPLGKQLLALSAMLGGYNGTQSFEVIATPIEPHVPLLWLRGLPALQGAAMVPLMFVTARAVGVSSAAALIPTAGILFDLCFLVESRLLLTDSTLLLGLLLQLWGCAASDRHAPLSRAWLLRTAAAGVGIALAVCTKWTGASALAVAGIHSLIAIGRSLRHCFRSDRGSSRRKLWRALLSEAVLRAALLLLVPVLIYLLSFWLHFRMLPETGDGARFMKPLFRAGLLCFSPAQSSIMPHCCLMPHCCQLLLSACIAPTAAAAANHARFDATATVPVRATRSQPPPPAHPVALAGNFDGR